MLKGVFLLTVALVDWAALPINFISLITNGGIFARCAHDVRAAAILAMVLFVLRIFVQASVFAIYRWGVSCKRPKNWRGRGFITEQKGEITVDEYRLWENWRDEFQTLTFNTWMMVPVGSCLLAWQFSLATYQCHAVMNAALHAVLNADGGCLCT